MTAPPPAPPPSPPPPSSPPPEPSPGSPSGPPADGVTDAAEGAWEERVEELTLMLMYLTAWRDEVKVGPLGEDDELVELALRSWKGYQFEVLDRFNEAGLTLGSKRAKSVHLTDDGVEQARDLLEEYGIGDVDPHDG